MNNYKKYIYEEKKGNAQLELLTILRIISLKKLVLMTNSTS